LSTVYQIEVGKDEEIREKILGFILQKRWNGALVIGAIGSVKEVRYFTPTGTDFPPRLESTTIAAPAEILSFIGEVMRAEQIPSSLREAYKIDGDYFLHIHASMAVAGGHVYGGGFQYGYALRGVNVFIQKAPNHT
jgi:predicted DNA-binding protein with PD1-like motif